MLVNYVSSLSEEEEFLSELRSKSFVIELNGTVFERVRGTFAA